MTGERKPDPGEGVRQSMERINRCTSVECAYCRDGCPAYLVLGFETNAPRGKNRVLADIIVERGLDDPGVQKALLACALCGRCAEVCISDADPYTHIPLLRAAASGTGETNPMEEPARRAFESGTPFGSKDTAWADGLPSKGKWGFYPGCNILANRPELAELVTDLMKGNGHAPVPMTDLCCGSPIYNAGMADEFDANAHAFVEDLKGKGVRKVVVSCPGCLNVLSNLHPRSRVEFIHLSEYLAEHPPEGGQEVVDRRVVFHDPCNLARKCGIVDAPREVLEALGYEIVEMDFHGREALCCGGGGGFAKIEPDGSRALAEARIADALAKGADAVVTCCLNCRDRLEREADGRIPVKLLTDLFGHGDPMTAKGERR